MITVKRIVFLLLTMILWSVFIGLGFSEGYLLRSIASQNESEAFLKASKEIINDQYVGNLAMVLLEEGEVEEAFFYTSDDKIIDEHSAFPVASISKWVTAVGVLKLVDQGKIDLDAPVESYLSRWQLPESEFDNSLVTPRRLLSHSAGLTDDLGYAGFGADEQIQTLEESLTKAADAPYSNGEARVGAKPGSEFLYSGAGYTILQLLIEEVSGKTFSKYMTTEVLEPLGMNNSSYELSDSLKVGLIPIYKVDSSTRAMNRFTAKAAASLLTSISDLQKFMNAMGTEQSSVLSSSMLMAMQQPESYRNGHPYYGLGPKLYLKRNEESPIIGHDGSGNNAINSAARLDLETGDGIIILETGNYSIASDLSDEWMFWKAGLADRVVMERNIPYLAGLLLTGYLIIISIYVFLTWRSKFKQP